eukprot:7379626-Prymnesium_polylepis.2
MSGCATAVATCCGPIAMPIGTSPLGGRPEAPKPAAPAAHCRGRSARSGGWPAARRSHHAPRRGRPRPGALRTARQNMCPAAPRAAELAASLRTPASPSAHRPQQGSRAAAPWPTSRAQARAPSAQPEAPSAPEVANTAAPEAPWPSAVGRTAAPEAPWPSAVGNTASEAPWSLAVGSIAAEWVEPRPWPRQSAALGLGLQRWRQHTGRREPRLASGRKPSGSAPTNRGPSRGAP